MQKNEAIIRQRIKEAEEEEERSFIERMKDYYFGPEKEQDIRDESDAVPMQEGGMAMPPQGMMPAAPPAAMPEMAQAQQAGMDPAILEQMLSQASQGIMALDEAEDYEQVMNSMRETDATIEERRMELADIVGEQDAQQTPESVLTLVQPVMMMAKVDEGIGGLAQG
jgi:exonuclease VII small subunit